MYQRLIWIKTQQRLYSVKESSRLRLARLGRQTENRAAREESSAAVAGCVLAAVTSGDLG